MKPWIKKWQNWFGSLWWIRWTAEYFSTRLIKTVDLDPHRSYIFAYHPHGVISMGANLALSTDGCNFTKVFPGVSQEEMWNLHVPSPRFSSASFSWDSPPILRNTYTSKIKKIQRSGVTLNVGFYVPFYRHWMLWLGYCSANRDTLKGRLEHGESIVLIPGGAVEALYSYPQSFCLSLSKRMGFLKLAQETDATIVPVLGFGENDLFDPLRPPEIKHMKEQSSSTTSTTLIWRIQQYLYKHLTFSTPIWFHFFPKNHVPLTVVVGAPVAFPDDSTLEERHSIYLKEIQQLYQDHQNQYGYENVPLTLFSK